MCRAGLILFAALVLTTRGVAQHVPAAPRRPCLLCDFFQDGQRSVATSLALVGREGELGVDGLMAWDPADLRSGPRIRLGAWGRRLPGRSRGGATAGLGYVASAGRARIWVGAEGFAGTGPGAGAAFVVRGGLGAGQVGLELRSAWWSDSARAILDSIGGRATAGVGPSRHTEAEVVASHRMGRLSIDGVGGARFGQVRGRSEWGWVTVAGRMTRNADLFASIGSRPDRPDRGDLSGSFLQVGLRFRLRPPSERLEPVREAPAPSPRFAVARDGDEAWRITLVVPSGQRVELTGDLTDWKVVPLVRDRGAPDAWRTTVSARPGVYHVAYRVDGGPWLVPPGLVAIPDGYNGLVGLLELR